MSDHAWNRKDEALLRALYPCTRTSELPARLGRSRSAIKNRVAALHLKKLPEASMHRLWLAGDDAVLREIYPGASTAAVAQCMGRSIAATYGRAEILGLHKSAAYLASPAACRLRRGDHVGARRRYPKGHVPANKGLRRPGWAPGRMKETQFKKGTLGGRAAEVVKPVGAERINADGYRDRKINNDLPFYRRWRAVHVLTWEAEHGPVPRGHLVAFANNDKTDIRLENLELRSRRDHMALNTVQNFPAPLKHAIQLLGAINRRINRRRSEEQDRRPA